MIIYSSMKIGQFFFATTFERGDNVEMSATSIASTVWLLFKSNRAIFFAHDVMTKNFFARDVTAKIFFTRPKFFMLNLKRT